MSRQQHQPLPSPRLLVLCLLSLLGVGEAHEASCHVCTGELEVANVMKSACQLLVFQADALTDGVSDACRAIQYQGVMEACCPTNPSYFCNLCEDGSKLPNPSKMMSTLTCAEAGGFASFVPSASSCGYFQAATGVYCGCNNPVASRTACRICGGNNLLPDPALQVDASSVFGGPQTRACSALEYFAQFSTAPLNGCSAYQDAFASECCAGLNTELPTPLPSPLPSKSPTTSQPSKSPTTLNPTNRPLMATTAPTTFAAPVNFAVLPVFTPQTPGPTTVVPKMPKPQTMQPVATPMTTVTEAPEASPDANLETTATQPKSPVDFGQPAGSSTTISAATTDVLERSGASVSFTVLVSSFVLVVANVAATF